jgi:GntR family transcriptional regulator/MocR family aminotransferase
MICIANLFIEGAPLRSHRVPVVPNARRTIPRSNDAHNERRAMVVSSSGTLAARFFGEYTAVRA